ncbi:hypothetical protein [Sulfoacidibacillus thermotolerans]|uniref:Uncharacterized protein n=1 Tax=Sulfoacidibacillus thermotolerans TaxID=1765684 RepID=A0A2U3CSP9_SULT2|nr:hypothetical protein [Sulfoacidibacillus thermotolerans]PWI52056.1 hypothetical protein BM613_14215 [Sulfoacidibacillus thermotolerans]
MKKRMWGIGVAALALTCFTLTGGATYSPKFRSNIHSKDTSVHVFSSHQDKLSSVILEQIQPETNGVVFVTTRELNYSIMMKNEQLKNNLFIANLFDVYHGLFPLNKNIIVGSPWVKSVRLTEKDAQLQITCLLKRPATHVSTGWGGFLFSFTFR